MPMWNKPNKKAFHAERNHNHGHVRSSHSSPVEEGEISSPPASHGSNSTANSSSHPKPNHIHGSLSGPLVGSGPHARPHPMHSRSGPSTFRTNGAPGSTNLTGSTGNGSSGPLGGSGGGMGMKSMNSVHDGTGGGNDTEEGEISAGPPLSNHGRPNAMNMSNRNSMNMNMNMNSSHNRDIAGPGVMQSSAPGGLPLGGAGGGMNRTSSFHNNPRRSSWQGGSTYNNISPKSNKPLFKPPKTKPIVGSYASLSETAEKRPIHGSGGSSHLNSNNDAHGNVKPDLTGSSHNSIPNWEPPVRNRSFQGRNSHYGSGGGGGGGADNHGPSHPPHHNASFNDRKRPNRPWENNNEVHPHKRHGGVPNHKVPWRDGHRDHRDRNRRDTSKPWEKPGRFDHSYAGKRDSSWRRGGGSSDGLGGGGSGSGGGPGSSGAGGGGGNVGGSYYGPAARNKRGNMENDNMHGHYGSGSGTAATGNSVAEAGTGLNKERDGAMGAGNSSISSSTNAMKKYGPGPRFQPPPHVMKNDDGNFSNNGTGGGLRVEEDRDKSNNNQESGPASTPSQRFRSPARLRLEGSLSAGRNQSHSQPHSSPYSSPSRRASIDNKWKPANNTASSSSGLANRFEAPDKNFIRTPSFVPPPPRRDDAQSREEGQIDWAPANNDQDTAANKALPFTPTLDRQSTETPVSSAPVVHSSPLSKLMCSALRDNDASQKAFKVTKMVSELVNGETQKNGEENSMSAPDNVELPDVDQITKGVQELKQQMKQGQQQMKLIKFKMKQAVQKGIQRKKAKEALEAKEEEERKSKEANRQKAEAEDLEADRKIALEKLAAENDAARKSSLEQIAAAKSSLVELEGKIVDRNKSNEAANAILAEKEILGRYEPIIDAAQRLSQQSKTSVSISSKNASEIESQLLVAERKLKDWNFRQPGVEVAKDSKVIESMKDMDMDAGSTDISMQGVHENDIIVTKRTEELKHLVTSIVHENQQRAAQAQYESLSIVVSEAAMNAPDSSLPPELLPETPIEDDGKSFDQYIASWTKRAQRVTGLGDALYSEPTQAPLYDNVQENHEEMRLLIREHVRSKKQRLHNRWTELAQEYAVREQLYEKDHKKDSSSIHSAELGGSFSICGQRRGGGAESNSNISSSFGVADTGGSRATNNPYRRARRSAGFQVGGCDIVRSDYEQEQIIAQLTAQENMEKRIKLGGSELPRQVVRVEKDLSVAYVDTMLSRRVDDALEDQRKHNLTNPWSDMEKCIFFDRFLQHPKDFRKIASFLKNKNTHDCISFYYNSKQSVPYKAALKEHQMRKKRRGDIVSWEATIQAAISLGATVTAGLNAEKPLLFHLPASDQTFTTRLLHPVKLELFDPNASEITYEESKEPKQRKKKSELATTFTLDPLERKYLRIDPANEKRSGSCSDGDSISSAKLSRSSSLLSVQDAKGVEQKNEVSSKKGTNKWSDNEKMAFFNALEKHGKKWETIAEIIGTKTATQVRNLYYDNKKQNEKNKAVGKGVSGKESSKVSKKDELEKIKKASSQNSNANEKSLTTDQIAMHLAQMNQTGGMPMPAPEHKNAASEILSGVVPGVASSLLMNQQVAWHDNNHHQLALALEQHHRQQQLSEQQRFLEHQQQFDRHRLEQIAQQHLIDQQRQIQQQHLIEMLNQQQSDVGGMSSWLAAQVLHQRQQQQDLQSSQHFQNVALAMRQFQRQHQQQSNLHLQPGGGIQGLNSSAELDQQQTTDSLSILARMAADQQNRNL